MDNVRKKALHEAGVVFFNLFRQIADKVSVILGGKNDAR
jgi:hypothetical protein